MEGTKKNLTCQAPASTSDARIESTTRQEGSSSEASTEGEADEPTSDEEEPGISRPKYRDHKPGMGPPMQNTWGGKSRDCHDGAGLCSLGRWLPPKRVGPIGEFSYNLKGKIKAIITRHIDNPVKLVCSMACGKISSCPFSDQMIAEAREAWLDSLADSVSQKEELVEINACQPFLLKAVGKRCG